MGLVVAVTSFGLLRTLIEFDRLASDGAAVITGCAARPVLAGSAQCVATFTTAGQHVIVAKYAGATGYQPSTSTNLGVRVT